MKLNDAQIGTPGILFKETKTNIEALSGIAEGATAYATDSNQFGSYNGSSWDWLGNWSTKDYPTWASGTPFVKMTAAGTFGLDTNTYLTGNQSITLTGAVTGSGTTSIATTFATPGTLTVSSTNSNVAAHTHAITSTSNATGASILASDANGALQLSRLGVGDAPAANVPVKFYKSYSDASGTNYVMFAQGQSARTGNGSQTLYGLRFLLDHNSASNETGSLFGLLGNVRNLANGTVTNAIGLKGLVSITTGSGVVTNASSVSAELRNDATGSITNGYLFIGLTPVVAGMSVAPTGLYGLYLENITGATSNYAIFSNKGLVSFGDQTTITGWQDLAGGQLKVVGHTTQTNTLVQFVRNDTAAGISAVLGLTGLGGGANGDGISWVASGKSSTTAAQQMLLDATLWTNATHASRTVLKRESITGNATAALAHRYFWASKTISTSQSIILDSAGYDLAVGATLLYFIKDETDNTTDGGVIVVANNTVSNLKDDGTNSVALTVGADGSLTVARVNGSHTYQLVITGVGF